MSEDLPVAVEIVDAEAQIRSFLEAIAPMMGQQPGDARESPGAALRPRRHLTPPADDPDASVQRRPDRCWRNCGTAAGAAISAASCQLPNSGSGEMPGLRRPSRD
jgi:hypothetical protein